MKQLLSGKDWLVSPFLPNEAGPHYSVISKVTAGDLYGGEFIPAQVPGDVQSDMLDAGLLEDINIGFNARKAEWTYQRDWMYVKRFTPEAVDCKKIVLQFDGVDYACDVFLNGQWLGYHENAWIPFSFDITEKIKRGEENCLIVLVKIAPFAQSQGGVCSQVDNLKPRFAYGWDWCTRLVPLGIWQNVRIDYQQDAAITDLYVSQDTDFESKKATIRAKLTLSESVENCPAVFTLTHPDAEQETVAVTITGTEAEVLFSVENAKLWWPNGMGEHPLYNVTVVIGDNWDSRSVNTGLRKITWQRVEGAGEDALPYQPYVNGRRMYIQGYNWVPIRQLYGREHKREYARRIELARRGNFNFLRVWGAGLLERECFYDLCDEKGILVMQELFQSSASMNNHPSREQWYIDMLCTTTESAVIQKRSHPCLAVWCGGNELCFRGSYMDADGNILIAGMEGWENRKYDVSGLPWVPLSPKYPTLAAMEKVVRRLDPDTAWWHTSGSGPVIQNASMDHLGGDMHDVHGPWQLMYANEFYTMYNALDMMAHMEFGSPGSASVQTLEKVIPTQFRWPLDTKNPMINYHGRMWTASEGSIDRIETYFGQLTDYKAYALTGRFLQWEQLRYSLEAHRRLGKRCAGACLWHMAEPWPNVIDTCSIDAYDQPKPAYYGQMKANKPLHIAPKYENVIHGDTAEIEMSVYNATEWDFSGSIHICSYDLNGKLLEVFDVPCKVGADTVEAVAAKFTFRNIPEGVLFLRYSLLDEAEKTVDTGYVIKSNLNIPYAPLLQQKKCRIKARMDGNTLWLKNTGKQIASCVTLESDNDQSVYFSDGCMMLLPGEEVAITVDFADDKKVPLYISGFGVPYQGLKV